MANGTWRLARGRGSAYLPLLIASVCAILLLVAGKTHLLPFERARTWITDKTAPALQAMNRPVVAVTQWAGGVGHFFDVYTENQRLHEENARLLQWRGAALALQDRVRRYQVLLKAVPTIGYSAVTAEVIARSSQPFMQTLILNAGQRNGVKPGEAVLDARGVLGRIYVAGDHTAWMILLTDLNSRIPVEIRPGDIPAILVGSNTAEPRLDAVAQNAKLKDGAEVVTSGDGGLLPAGLPVGLVTTAGGERKVALYSDALTASDVRVLDYRSPIEPMPKPTDKDLPAPPDLKPPAPPAGSTPGTATAPPAVAEKPAAKTPAPARKKVAPAIRHTPELTLPANPGKPDTDNTAAAGAGEPDNQ